jgi:hypothetical protein
MDKNEKINVGSLWIIKKRDKTVGIYTCITMRIVINDKNRE